MENYELLANFKSILKKCDCRLSYSETQALNQVIHELEEKCKPSEFAKYVDRLVNEHKCGTQAYFKHLQPYKLTDEEWSNLWDLYYEENGHEYFDHVPSSDSAADKMSYDIEEELKYYNIIH